MMQEGSDHADGHDLELNVVEGTNSSEEAANNHATQASSSSGGEPDVEAPPHHQPSGTDNLHPTTTKEASSMKNETSAGQLTNDQVLSAERPPPSNQSSRNTAKRPPTQSSPGRKTGSNNSNNSPPFRPTSPQGPYSNLSPRPSPRSPIREKFTSPMANFINHVKRASTAGFDAGASSDDDSEINFGLSEIPNLNDSNPAMTLDDIDIFQKLDDEYERALEEREIGYNARYASVRQSAFLSVFFMASYMMLGTAFFMRQADWSVPDSLLFSIYTITTVGYGHHQIPTTPGFQAYTIFYILIGIASLTIMVAQVYQCIALEASRAQHSRDRTEMERRGLDILNISRQGGSSHGDGTDNSTEEIIQQEFQNMPGAVDQAFRYYEKSRKFFRDTELGRSVSFLFPFAGLILIGAIIVGPIEGWTLLESIYFSVVSLTTVGFGDYYPTKRASIWFCIFWLPFSVGFMSMFLGNVAAFYIRLSDRNIHRIERHMRRRLERAKRLAELERAEVLKRAYRGQESMIEATNSGKPSDETDRPAIPQHHAAKLKKKTPIEGPESLGSENELDSDDDDSAHQLFGSSPMDSGTSRRERFLTNLHEGGEDGKKTTMRSMRDVLKAVHRNMEDTGGNQFARKNNEFMSIRSSRPMKSHTMPSTMIGREARKPSFALRVLVQERFSQIIAIEVAGYQSSIEIKENTLSVTIESLQDTADKWLIPRRARKAFRSAAFEILYFVGEHGLITRGAEALYDLTPFEFHGLFNPLLASMGDAETMEAWLANTEVLADVDLKRDNITRPNANIGIRTVDHFEQLPSGAPPPGNRASAAFSRLTPNNAFST